MNRAWRLTEDQINEANKNTNPGIGGNLTGILTTDLETACEMTKIKMTRGGRPSIHSNITAEDMDDNCVSLVTMWTYMSKINITDIPLSDKSQEKVKEKITHQVVVDDKIYNERLSGEILNRCDRQESDFIFLIDSSGSIGQKNWENATRTIADKYIKKFIKPSKSFIEEFNRYLETLKSLSF